MTQRNPTDEELATLAQFSVGTIIYVLQGIGIRRGFIPVRSVTPESDRFIGRARTLRTVPTREDVARRLAQSGQPSVHRQAFDDLSLGEVLVIAARGHVGAAVMGDVLAQRVRAQGGSAVLTDGCVRDITGVRDVGLPVFAAGVHAATFSTEHFAVDRDLPVDVAGTLVLPGDVLVGDDEGVAAIPVDVVGELLERLPGQERLDQFGLRKLAEGHPLRDVLPLAPYLRAQFDAEAP